MIDEICKEHRKTFEEETGARKQDFLPRKYVPQYIEQDRKNMYDHEMMYRNKEYDFLFISNYGEHYHETLLEESFKECPSMYNTSCQSYMKVFLNTKTSVIKEAPE